MFLCGSNEWEKWSLGDVTISKYYVIIIAITWHHICVREFQINDTECLIKRLPSLTTKNPPKATFLEVCDGTHKVWAVNSVNKKPVVSMSWYYHKALCHERCTARPPYQFHSPNAKPRLPLHELCLAAMNHCRQRMYHSSRNLIRADLRTTGSNNNLDLLHPLVPFEVINIDVNMVAMITQPQTIPIVAIIVVMIALKMTRKITITTIIVMKIFIQRLIDMVSKHRYPKPWEFIINMP